MVWPLSDKTLNESISVDDWNTLCERVADIGGTEDYASPVDTISDGLFRYGMWPQHRNFATEFSRTIWAGAGLLTYINIQSIAGSLWRIDARLTHLLGFLDYERGHCGMHIPRRVGYNEIYENSN